MLYSFIKMATIKILQVPSVNDDVGDWESPSISTTVLENWISTKDKHILGSWFPKMASVNSDSRIQTFVSTLLESDLPFATT